MENERPISPSGVAMVSYMRSGGGGSSVVTMRFNPVSSSYVDKEIPLLPPPPMIGEADSSWDYFDLVDVEDSQSFRLVGSSGVDVGCDDIKGWREMRSEEGNEFDVGSKMLEVSGGLVTQNESEGCNANGESRQLVVGGRNENEGSRRVVVVVVGICREKKKKKKRRRQREERRKSREKESRESRQKREGKQRKRENIIEFAQRANSLYFWELQGICSSGEFAYQTNSLGFLSCSEFA